MTLLTICQDALREIGTHQVPTSFIGNNDGGTAENMLALANKAGKLLATARPEGWQVQQIRHEFLTEANEDTYDFPGGFAWPISATWWDRHNQWYMHGPTSPQDWQSLKAYVSSASIRRHWRIRGDKIMIYPTPTTTGDPIVFEYATRYWCSSADGQTLRDRWAADNDVALLDEDLLTMSVKWRFLKERGFPYEEDFNDYERELAKKIARDGGLGPVRMTGAGNTGFYPIANTPEGNFAG